MIKDLETREEKEEFDRRVDKKLMERLREMDDREIERGCRKFRPDYSVAELEMWFAAEEKQQRLSLVEGKDGI